MSGERAPTPDNTELSCHQPPLLSSSLLSVVSDLKVSGQDIAPGRRGVRTTETTETGCLSGQDGQIGLLCHKVY